jgi:hypothetical protein
MLMPERKRREKLANERVRLQKQAAVAQQAIKEEQQNAAKKRGGCGCNKKKRQA